MFVEIPQDLILMIAAAFLIGWVLASISARIGARHKARKRDPRDDRIRALEAELRVAQSDASKYRDKCEALDSELQEARSASEKRDKVIAHQQERIDALRRDLKDSVKKTRELRYELSDRAEENVRSEARIREVETELSVAQASTDLIATGVLDYSVAPDAEDAEEQHQGQPENVPKRVS